MALEIVSTSRGFGGVQGVCRHDVGEADPVLQRELEPELLEAACAASGQPLTLRRQPGYNHSDYFISTFMADHLRRRVEHLT